MKIYTRTGDKGDTGLFGGDRVNKDHLRIEAYGTVDETNSALGIARALCTEGDLDVIDAMLHHIQSELFVLGADLATPSSAKVEVPRIESTQIERLERFIDQLENDLPPLKHFILPGGTQAAAAIHMARTVCRRAERRTISLQLQEEINVQAAIYLNRLSDLLFVMARWLNNVAGIEEKAWKPA